MNQSVRHHGVRQFSYRRRLEEEKARVVCRCASLCGRINNKRRVFWDLDNFLCSYGYHSNISCVNTKDILKFTIYILDVIRQTYSQCTQA